MKQTPKGKIHSFETFGTVDGPGIRFVIFFAECPLRCIYCHNIDVVMAKNAPTYSVQDIVKMVLKQKDYLLSSGGGVTATGGDPVLQIDFIAELFKALQQQGIHTAFDTSLMTTKSQIDKLLPVTDLFMVSIKQLDDAMHKKLTGASNTVILENVKYLSSKTKNIWFRYLVLPGCTDRKRDIDALIRFIKPLRFKLLELLPYHTLGVWKWKKLNLPYKLKGVRTPYKEEMVKIRHWLERANIPVKCEY